MVLIPHDIDSWASFSFGVSAEGIRASNKLSIWAYKSSNAAHGNSPVVRLMETLILGRSWQVVK